MSRSRGSRSLTTRSPMRMSPSVISSRPASIRSAVLFPQPDGPTRTTNSPSAISSDKSLTAAVPSKTLLTFSYVTRATASSLLDLLRQREVRDREQRIRDRHRQERQYRRRERDQVDGEQRE